MPANDPTPVRSSSLIDADRAVPTASSRRLLHRRTLLAAAMPLPFIGGCAHPLPPAEPPRRSAEAAQRLLDSARMHGLDAYLKTSDINVSYDGEWRPIIESIQPVVVDAGFRGRSQERVLPVSGVVAQAYSGVKGRKQVVWRRGAGDSSADSSSIANRGSAAEGRIGVWFNGTASTDAGVQQAAAVVAECYGLFLLGPLWVVGRNLPAEMSGTERVDGRLCDVVQVWLTPGLGLSPVDRVAFCIDRADDVTRRLRFTLEGYPNTQGAVAITDTFDHQRRHGVLWPMRSYEEVVHPLRVPAHDWRITGLDVNRGYGAEAVSGPEFTGAAAAAAAPV